MNVDRMGMGFPFHEPIPLLSVTRGQCDTRSAVTFSAAEHHRPLVGTKLYCLVTEASECELLVEGRWPGVELATC